MNFADIHNIGHKVKTVLSIVPVSQAAGTVEGTSTDRLNFQSCRIAGMVGSVINDPSSQSVTFKLQHSDDDVTFTDVTGGGVTAITADDTITHLDFDLGGTKRYVRLYATVAFTGGVPAPSIPIAGLLILGGSTSLRADDA